MPYLIDESDRIAKRIFAYVEEFNQGTPTIKNYDRWKNTVCGEIAHIITEELTKIINPKANASNSPNIPEFFNLGD